ncbi:hypothetical protein ColTof4_00604 [Colletotrichum tofieldiae]|nr:hypothetical protein ColTof3_07813 [Colletotrichum tofieldiae]GKT68181.1 hypothetical protein ColTof4_00604 [Colletotrichum tofieldiae]GKT90819.1 hypothetical protein Ct61P_08669 [Colletotrichum tofieldiae]
MALHVAWVAMSRTHGFLPCFGYGGIDEESSEFRILNGEVDEQKKLRPEASQGGRERGVAES